MFIKIKQENLKGETLMHRNHFLLPTSKACLARQLAALPAIPDDLTRVLCRLGEEWQRLVGGMWQPPVTSVCHAAKKNPCLQPTGKRRLPPPIPEATPDDPMCLGGTWNT